jgi:DNA-binding CsgD family transcriptional regulator
MRNKNNVRHRKGGYQKWLDEHEGYDALLPENLGDVASPFSLGIVPPLIGDAYEILENLYYNGGIKGRQKQIVGLLFDGVTSQVEMAKQLNMKQSNVAIELRKIAKKITAGII